MDTVSDDSPEIGEPFLTRADQENLDRAAMLTRIDVREHNHGTLAPSFSPLVSQACSAEQFSHPEFLHWHQILHLAQDGHLPFVGWSTTVLHRKVWEWAFVFQVAKQYDLLRPGVTAVGFGVGNEPVPAVLASHGMHVVATDQAVEESTDWDTTGRWVDSGQLMTGLEGLYRPQLLPNNRFTELVETRRVNMNDVPPDLAPCDLVWSSCALEHLGSPEKGLQFAMASARLLAPGGVAVHTTELELTARLSTADWGHLACYRPEDIRYLAGRAQIEGFEMEANLHVPMDGPEDRMISLLLTHGPDLATIETVHLKVALFESVVTSFGIVLRRPSEATRT